MTQALDNDGTQAGDDDPVQQWVTFQLGGETYGINVLQVREVLRVTDITPVPGSQEYVLGIINLRGNVVTVIDCRRCFDLPDRQCDYLSRIVIVEASGQTVGVLVDSVAEVVYLPSSQIDHAPTVGAEESAKHIQGVYSRNDELLILVDLNKLIAIEEVHDLA
jgi:purine-binding chemotaxis protein CheW